MTSPSFRQTPVDPTTQRALEQIGTVLHDVEQRLHLVRLSLVQAYADLGAPRFDPGRIDPMAARFLLQPFVGNALVGAPYFPGPHGVSPPGFGISPFLGPAMGAPIGVPSFFGQPGVNAPIGIPSFGGLGASFRP